VARLEAIARPQMDHCRTCGLRHVQPITLDLARRIIGVTEWASLDLQCRVAQNPAPKLCLCEPCCGDPGDSVLARMTHGMDEQQGTI
jgi:hypothetical protein